MKKIVLLFNMLILFTIVSEAQVIKYSLPEGDLKWSLDKPKDAKMCIPAAFTSKSGKVLGSYRYKGKSYNANGKLKVSLKGDTFSLNKYWTSDNGFEQLTLVHSSKPKRFKDSRKAIRRALCKNDGITFLLESLYPMTLSEFAYQCSKKSTDAVYLDMGEYGYGYITIKNIKYPLHLLGFLTRHKQTNWLYIE